MPNFGFPCLQGDNYPEPLYSQVCSSNSFDMATFVGANWNYSHPTSPGVISAIAVHPVTGDIWFGDYVNAKIMTVPAKSGPGTPAVTVIDQSTAAFPQRLFPVHLAFIVPPGAKSLNEGMMHYIDTVKGTVVPIPQSLVPAKANGASSASIGFATLACAITIAIMSVIGVNN